jgi:hypothetical protein
MKAVDAFSPDYATARRRFRERADQTGFSLTEHAVDQVGPTGEPLFIDVAWKGDPRPRFAAVVSSGTHGIEGYFGSAVQLSLLDGPWGAAEVAEGCALVLVHAINPYGFAWNRRVNEDNVDLNRNFLLAGQAFEGATDGYRRLDGLLNPPSAPAGFDAFLARAALQVMRHGLGALKAAVAVGQYDYPEGLFYGGDGPARSQRLLAELVPRWFGGTERVIHLDMHTGMGARGTCTLAVEENDAGDRVRWLAARFGRDAVSGLSEDGVLYPIRGAFGPWLQEQVPACDYRCMLAEFGTQPVLRVLQALRTENRAHHHGTRGDPSSERATRGLLAAFAPASEAWRRSVVDHAVKLAETARGAMADPAQ